MVLRRKFLPLSQLVFNNDGMFLLQGRGYHLQCERHGGEPKRRWSGQVDRSALFTNSVRRHRDIVPAKQKRGATSLNLPEAYFMSPEKRCLVISKKHR